MANRILYADILPVGYGFEMICALREEEDGVSTSIPLDETGPMHFSSKEEAKKHAREIGRKHDCGSIRFEAGAAS